MEKKMIMFRHYYTDVGPHITTLNFNAPEINFDSVVLITASEYIRPDNPPPPPANFQRFIGLAPIGVLSIAPHGPPFDVNHGVTFVVDIGHPNALNVVVDIVVLDGLPRQ
jgi:hypothetical protein